jgi:uncharacterized protein
MKMLPISESLKLPIDAATQTFAAIGRKRSGKTYAIGKLVELLIRAGVQVCILDTVGNWYGLRIAANGKDPGIDIPILGGLRGDVPLEPTTGALIADVAIDSGRSLVIDCSQFSKADRQRFAHAFGEQLWKRKKGEEHPSPIHLVLEESQLIVPENVQGDTAKMVGIYEEIIRLGGNYGIGISMITQRPQSVNKEVLNQTECLLVFQVNGFHERKALKDWIRHQGMDMSLVDELPSLKAGNCYVWSPQWLEILEKIKIAPKETFDSTATPKVGGVSRGARVLKEIDLEELKSKMAETIEKAKADDPKVLRARIRQLEIDLRGNRKEITLAHLEKARLEGFAQAFNRFIDTASTLLKIAQVAHDDIGSAFINMISILKPVAEAKLEKISEYHKIVINPQPAPKTLQQALNKDGPAQRRETRSSYDLNGIEIPPVGQKILDALAELENMGAKVPKRVMVAFLAGYSNLNSKGFTNAIGTLSTRGLIHYPDKGSISLTEDGRKLASFDSAPRTPQEVQKRVIELLGGKSREILRPLIDEYPNALERFDVAGRAGYTNLNSKGFTNALGRLSSLGFVMYPEKGMVKASPVLFLEE